MDSVPDHRVVALDQADLLAHVLDDALIHVLETTKVDRDFPGWIRFR